MDIRQAFLDALSNTGYCQSNYASLFVKGFPLGTCGQECGVGVVTADGEHPNLNGATIMSQLYAKQLNIWFPVAAPSTASIPTPSTIPSRTPVSSVYPSLQPSKRPSTKPSRLPSLKPSKRPV